MKLFNFLEKSIDMADIEEMDSIIGNIKERLSIKTLAFHIATSYIADTMSKCEIKHFVKGELVKDEFYYLLNVSPNVNQNASQLKTKLIFKLFNDGEVLLFENSDNLYVADSYQIEPNPLKGDKFTNITLDDELKTFTKKASEVFYFKLDDGRLRLLIGNMLDDFTELLNYSFSAYKSSNSEKYKLVLDEVEAGNKDFKEKFEKVIKKQLESFINNPKVVYPQFKGHDLQKIHGGDGKTDSTDIRNLRREIFEATAEAFKMPVSMLYGNMTNAKDIISSYVTFRIDPLAKMISEELTRKTGTVDDYVNGTYFDVDTTMIMHTDIFEIADRVDKLIASGTYCIDELRVKLGENALDTEFSTQHWMTKNYSKIEDVLGGDLSSNSEFESIKKEVLADENADSAEAIALTSLNGAQIQSLLLIVKAVSNGELNYESAIALITSSFPFDEETARKILGDKNEEEQEDGISSNVEGGE